MKHKPTRQNQDLYTLFLNDISERFINFWEEFDHQTLLATVLLARYRWRQICDDSVDVWFTRLYGWAVEHNAEIRDWDVRFSQPNISINYNDYGLNEISTPRTESNTESTTLTGATTSTPINEYYDGKTIVNVNDGDSKYIPFTYMEWKKMRDEGTAVAGWQPFMDSFDDLFLSIF